MKLVKRTWHAISYATWLTGQIVVESVAMAFDTLGQSGKHIAPIVLYYPLRVTSERDIAAFIASITMTPGTLALGVTGPKEVDYDAAAGNRDRKDAFAVADSEFKTHGLDHVQRFLAIHAMYGEEPEELLYSLADMEEHLAPHVKEKELKFSVEYLVERGRPGPRGFRGSRGGRASDETVFDVEKVDSTPHAAAFVAAILQMDDEEPDISELKDMDPKSRYAVAQRHAERAQARRDAVVQGAVDGDKAMTFTTDIDSTSGDNLGASCPDRQRRTKPGETLYDPLYPDSNPRDGDVDGSQTYRDAPKNWYEKKKQELKRRKGRS